MNSIIKTENIVKTYDMGTVKVHALRGVNVNIQKGEYVSIMGPSGSGKTTLLDVLSCLLRPTRGEVYINDDPISKMSDNELAIIRGQTIGFVFQSFNLISKMSVLENVMLPLWFQGTPKKEREKIARNILENLGLGDRFHHMPSEISGGQKQRVAIARALAVNPEIIVADEPTGNLDSTSGKEVLKILDGLHKRGRTILMVTHEKDVAERAERRIYIKDGKIIKDVKMN